MKHEYNELFTILDKEFGDKINVARIKLISMLILSLCKVQTINFSKLSSGFDSNADSLSSMRRLQRFLSGYALNFDLISQFIMRLLPHKGPYTLSMDRTNWKFGQLNINALVIGITYRNVAFPILFSLLPKRGNSNTAERIKLIDKYIELFGIETIGCLVADREFVGERWVEYLNGRGISYHLRIRENFLVKSPRTGRVFKAFWAFNHLKLGQSAHMYKIYYIHNQLCYLSGAKLKNKDGKPELQIIVSYNKPETAINSYKDRWQIETCFRALKTSGFNIEDTHMVHLIRIERMFAIVIMAFAWAYRVGIYKDEQIKPIRILKNGRRAKSIFKYGLEHIANQLLNPSAKQKISIYNFLSCT